MSNLQIMDRMRIQQSRGELNAFDTWLNASPDAEPMAGDEQT